MLLAPQTQKSSHLLAHLAAPKAQLQLCFLGLDLFELLGQTLDLFLIAAGHCLE